QAVAGAAIEPHLVAVLAGDDAEAVVLDLMEPCVPGWRLRGFSREAGRDEAEREGHGQAYGTVALGKSTTGPKCAAWWQLTTHFPTNSKSKVSYSAPSILGEDSVGDWRAGAAVSRKQIWSRAAEAGSVPTPCSSGAQMGVSSPTL